MAARTAAERLRRYLKKLEPGTVFTPAELVQARLGSAQAVRQALHRLASDGAVRRLAKGYYDLPRTNPRIGPLSPTPEAIVAAHARKTGGIVERPEIDAANKLGLTTQVAARPVYRTNLFPRDLNIAGQRIQLRTTGPRSLARDADPAELVIDALQAIGKRRVTSVEIATLRQFVQEHGLAKKLKRRAQRAPTWMVPFVDEILASE
ncbi:MAG TPA: DUF6088 family protein [Candidatus Cybelea sp.]|jgi:hypothetical protein